LDRRQDFRAVHIPAQTLDGTLLDKKASLFDFLGCEQAQTRADAATLLFRDGKCDSGHALECSDICRSSG
jgi:hypothetical protein